MSLVNWVKSPGKPVTAFELDGERVVGITPSLTAAGGDEWTPVALDANKGKCFQGPIPVGAGFIVDQHLAQSLLADPGTNYHNVVRPYVVGEDIARGVGAKPSRWIVDFGQRTLEAATQFPRALEIVRRDVKPFRETVRREGHRAKWWQFGEPRVSMRGALVGHDRYAVGTAQGKRLVMAWQEAAACPRNLVNVFAFDDDYSMGILLSRTHDAWAWAQSSTLKGDLRYTPTTVFATFPWPDPTDAQRGSIGAATKSLYEGRSALCLEHNLGLTKLYNLMDEGGFQDLKKLHKALDEAVAAAYGWPKSVSQDPAELVARLRDLNRDIVEGKRPYAPFA